MSLLSDMVALATQYVNSAHRHEVGGWVFYSAEDPGVREDLEPLSEEEEVA